MKALLKIVLLRHPERYKAQGFTLIELLVVVVMVGVLSAIALPAFLKQADKARQTEAKVKIGTMNRAQQGYIMEHLAFATNLQDLGVGIQDSSNYSYLINSSSGSGTLHVFHHAKSLNPEVSPHVGMVTTHNEDGALVAQTLICAANEPALGTAVEPDPDALSCADGTYSISTAAK